MDLKTLSIPPNRRRVCYGPAGQEELEILVPLSLSTYGIASSKASLSEKKLHGFISSCHRMKLSRQEREQFRLQRLKLIYRRFETITLFKSWYKYLLCRRIHRRHTLFFHLMKWRKCYLLARYSILSALVNRMTPLLRSAFQIWWRVTLHLRAAEFYRRNLLVRMMRSWKLLLENSSKRLLLNYFQRWKLYLLLLTKLRKLVST